MEGGSMTYRERREARAERLRGWADKRQQEASTTIATINERYRGDHAFNTQPGHIPERARVIAQEDRAFRSMEKAESMASRASTIEHQLDTSIYSDDPDAVERLEAKVAELEAERAAIKAHNVAMRKAGTPEKCWPAYKLSNLGGNIKRTRERIADVRRRQARAQAAEAAEGGVVVTGQDYVTVTFADKPPRSTLDAMKVAGFHWSGGSWHGRRDRIPAEVKGEAR